MTLTTTALEAFITDLRSNDSEVALLALLKLGGHTGEGFPASEAYAEALGGDYICALEDGTIVAWGADHADGGCEVVTIDPSQQVGNA